jgi:hypothetical protein
VKKARELKLSINIVFLPWGNDKRYIYINYVKDVKRMEKPNKKELEKGEGDNLKTGNEDAPKKTQKNKKALIAIGLVLLIIIAITSFYFLKVRVKPPESFVNMSLTRDLGAVTIRGDGLPGYDIDRDGEADYLSKGFGYYKEIYQGGGFEYGPGALLLEEFGTEIMMPRVHFINDTLVESGVGSVVIFSAKENVSGFEGTFVDGESYTITDLLGVEGAGEIGEREVEIVGRMIIRE